MLSASANKLSRLKEQAEEYAALIMEELDPERFGYIEVGPLFARTPSDFLQFETIEPFTSFLINLINQFVKRIVNSKFVNHNWMDYA